MAKEICFCVMKLTRLEKREFCQKKKREWNLRNLQNTKLAACIGGGQISKL